MMDGQLMPDVDRGSPRVFAGRYQVERMIARGGMGEVYLCTDLDLRRPVALKILRAGVDNDDGGRFMERFRLEARTLATLNHANIVTLYEYGETDDGQLFLALEYIDGPRFTDLARQGPMDPMRLMRLTMQVCRALRFAHRRGVVHRDLKPSNLLIRVDEDGEEQIKVVDFGLVKVIEDDQALTRAGLILGSPHCMAPEQIRGLSGVDHRADIYAVGVLMYRALVGQWPFHGETSTATMIAHINQPVPRFRDLNPDIVVPPGLEDIVRRCLEKDPTNRYADVRALMADLREITGQPATVTHSNLTLSGGSTESSLVTSQSRAVVDTLPTGQQASSVQRSGVGGQLMWIGMGVGLSVLMLVMVVGVWMFTRAAGVGDGADVAAHTDEGAVVTTDALQPGGQEAPKVIQPIDDPTPPEAPEEAPAEEAAGAAAPPEPAEPEAPKAAPKKQPKASSKPKRSPKPAPKAETPAPEPKPETPSKDEPGAAAPTDRGATYDADDIF